VLEQYGGFAGVGGTAKHYWIPLVVGAAVIVGLATWTIRRRHGGGMIEPTAEQIRKDFG